MLPSPPLIAAELTFPIYKPASYLRVLILASRHPKAFVAGADIKAMSEQTPLQKTRFGELGARLPADRHATAPPH